MVKGRDSFVIEISSDKRKYFSDWRMASEEQYRGNTYEIQVSQLNKRNVSKK